ncbi:MAG: CaiB/BaiF CoA-transferase family protein [Acidimicrobiia bacterium]
MGDTSEAPLAGIVVLDMSRLQPGGFCTRLLADLGADVVKIEGPGGDPSRMWGGPEPSPSAVALHRGKRSLTLDLKHARAAEVLRRLVADADVLLESARPGSLEASGIGYPQLSAVNPRLVWCSLSGFGLTGPKRDHAGHDITYLGHAGVLGLMADVDAVPDQPRLLLAAPMGGMMAALGITSALAQRANTGRGCMVDASIADAAMWLMTEEVTRSARNLAPYDLRTPARRVYPCADGRRVSVAAAEPRTWVALCTALELTDLGDRPGGPPDAAADTVARIGAALATKPAAHWADVLGGAGVAMVNDTGDLVDDPQVQARGGVTTLDVGAGTDQVVTSPLRFSTSDAASDDGWSGPGPMGFSAPGADTDAVLATAGFTDDEIATLRADGVVA